MNIDRPQVGVCVLIRKDRKILFGLRKNSHGEGTWAPPGGHLEYKESPEECAVREVMEETGLDITNLRRATYTNDFFSEGKYYVTLYIVADYQSGEVENKEPDKCERWEWFSWDGLPEPLFLTVQHLLEQGFDPFSG